MIRVLRTGKVSSINYKQFTARVEFHDAPGNISRELQILTNHTNREKKYSMPSIGEDVVCIFFENAPTRGFILGAYYTEQNPPIESGNIKYIFFPDGTRLKYHLEASILEVDCVGEINISSGSVVNIRGKEVNIQAESFNVSADESNFDHDINCADVVTDKGSMNEHPHTGDSGGKTSPPYE